ncbi:hypothetical protein RhiirA4_237143 [Rhizophagus irregularis]|uniref:Uncharacterized protein n=1 Tax=Rhizophagus irregularis TaxID=588596 RepID=A0A2I1GQS8_9GLOM|nr:hypothetical protein RhiirA4_237143 [Rhizophagus irregularis]
MIDVVGLQYPDLYDQIYNSVEFGSTDAKRVVKVRRPRIRIYNPRIKSEDHPSDIRILDQNITLGGMIYWFIINVWRLIFNIQNEY